MNNDNTLKLLNKYLWEAIDNTNSEKEALEKTMALLIEDRKLFEAVAEPLVKARVWSLILQYRSRINKERLTPTEKVRQRLGSRAAQQFEAGQNRANERLDAYASYCLMNYRLSDGTLLGEASRKLIRENAERHELLSETHGKKSAWLYSVSDEMTDPEASVRSQLTEERLRSLADECGFNAQ